MDQAVAKQWSEQFLRTHGITVNEHLPFIEAVDELSPQSAQSVAIRTIVLHHMAGLGFGVAPNEMKQLLVGRGLISHLSDQETVLVNSAELTQQQKNNCSWLPECIQSLAFCLGVAELNVLNQADDDLAQRIPVRDGEREEFIKNAKLRPFEEIYQQSDLHYRLHWAARDARLRSKECIVQEGFVLERRKAIDWVVGVEPDWDEVPCDT